MAKKIMVAHGTYEKDGQTKTNWKEIGVILTSQNGKEYCLLDPTINLGGFTREAGKDKLIASIFDDKPQQQQQQQSQYAQPAPAPAPITMDMETLPF